MDYDLHSIVARTATEGKFIAHSLDFNISALGDNPQEAAEKLARLASSHARFAESRGINPNILSSDALELYGNYCAKNRHLPPELKPIEVEDFGSMGVLDLTR